MVCIVGVLMHNIVPRTTPPKKSKLLRPQVPGYTMKDDLKMDRPVACPPPPLNPPEKGRKDPVWCAPKEARVLTPVGVLSLV